MKMKTSHPFSDASWDDVRLFLAAVEHGSFTTAAKALGLGQATLSRRVAALERQLGLSLFDRHRGGLSVTPAGRRVIPWAESMAAAMRDASAALAGLEATPSGRVRVTCAPGVAFDFGPVLVRRLRVAWPQLLVEVLADARVRDLSAHEADIALRSSAPSAGPLLVKKLLEVPVGLYASKTLLRRLPRRPTLAQVPLLDWSDELPTLAQALAPLPCPRAMVTNDFLTMCAAAEAGIGAMVTTSLQAELRGLQRVDVPFPTVPPQPMYLVVHQALRRVPRVQVVVEAIEALLRELTPRVSRSPTAPQGTTSPSPP